MPSATGFLRNRTHLPPVAHRWRSFLALQRREAEVEKSKRWGVGVPRFQTPDLASSPFCLLGSARNLDARPWNPASDPSSWGLRGTGMEAEGGGELRAPPLCPTQAPAPHKTS